MKLLITGSRKWTDYDLIETIINKIKPKLIIHGGCEGADLLADQVANTFFYSKKVFLADWATLGKKAGPIRNQQMINEKPDTCVVFHEDPNLGTGTRDCVTRCLQNGIPVRLFLLQNGQIIKNKVRLDPKKKIVLEPF